ncbi:MAG: adenylyl-sulfate kinase [Spirochaetaceae bacterium]|nr:adenylyl-sulfate kinase [Spirochaetaceae bacterium]MDE0449552.1 adenylyl-sulfate kinase [Spirochaetaceae bacterium]
MAVFWLTGMPCSGKTTIGRALVDGLGAVGRVACLVDGDVVRRGELSRGLGFSAADRLENVRRVAALAARLARDIDVVVAMVSPTEQIREPARELPGLVMVGLHCPPGIARQRDYKGVYRRPWDAAAYETPVPADCIVDTSLAGVAESVERILSAAGLSQPLP